MGKRKINWIEIHEYYVNGLTLDEIIKKPEAIQQNITKKQITQKAYSYNWIEERRYIVERTRHLAADKMVEEGSDGLKELTDTFKKRWERLLSVTDAKLFEKDKSTGEVRVSSRLDLLDLVRASKIMSNAQKGLAHLLQVPMVIKLNTNINDPQQIRMMAEAEEKLEKLRIEFDNKTYPITQDKWTDVRHGIKEEDKN